MAQVLVRDEQDVVLGQLGDDVHGVGGGHADVAPALDFHGRVHIAHDGEVIAILLARSIHRLALNHVRHGTIRRGLGKEDVLVRVEELCALAHELNAREHDRTLRQRLRELCQIERVAHVVRHCLDLGSHIVVREDHGISLRLEALDGGGKLGGNKRGTLRGRGTRTHAVCDELRELLGGRIAGRRVDACQPGPSRWEMLGDSMARVMSCDKTAVKTIWPKGTRPQKGTGPKET